MRVDLLHRDTSLHLTNERAKIAANAFVLIHAWNPRERCRVRFVPTDGLGMVKLRNRRHGNRLLRNRLTHRRSHVRSTSCPNAIEMNTLMRAVPTGGVTQFAPDAFLFMNPRNNFVVQIQVLPLLHSLQTFAL